MRKLCILFLCVVLLAGCSKTPTELIENGDFDEALQLVEEEKEKYSDVYDEIRFKVAQNRFQENDYEGVLELLKENEYDGKKELEDQTKYLLAEIEYANGNYEEAFSLLLNNNYTETDVLLDKINQTLSLNSFSKYYQELQDEKDEYNPDKWISDFDWLDGMDFCERVRQSVINVRDEIVKDGTVDGVIEEFYRIFGYYPEDTEEATQRIETFYDDMNFSFSPNIDTIFLYLDAICSKLLWNEFVRTEMTDTKGFMIIENPYQFFKSNKISEETFANLCGVLDDYGVEIEVRNEKIEITWFKESAGYPYCISKEDQAKFMELCNNENLEFYHSAVYDYRDSSFTVTCHLDNLEGQPYKYVVVKAILTDMEDNVFGYDFAEFNNVTDSNLSFSYVFNDVDLDLLSHNNKYNQYNLYYIWTVIYE